jgi:hypothetical protein
MHKYFLITPVYKQLRYNFKEFILAQFARFLKKEAVLKKLGPEVTRTVKIWSLVLETL